MTVEIDSPGLTAADRAWFTEQVETLLGELFGTAVRLCRDQTDAEDLVVVMVDVQGLAYRDVAEILDIPIGTVRSRLARARSHLQRALWEHALEAGLRDGPHPSEKNNERDRGQEM